MKIAPCKGCGKRQLGCHSKCEPFAEWRAELEKMKEARRKIFEEEDFIIQNVARMRKRR